MATNFRQLKKASSASALIIALVLIGTGVIGSNLARGTERVGETSHSLLFAYLGEETEHAGTKTTGAARAATVATTQPELFAVEQSQEQADLAAHVSGEVLTKPTLAVVKDTEKRTVREFTYVVQSGDTLSKIAEKFDISTPTLQVANNLPINTTLVPGQQLQVLPVNGVRAAVTSDDQTVASLVEKYNGDLDKTLALNKIEDEKDLLTTSSSVIVVDGTAPVPQPEKAPEPAKPTTTTTTARAAVASSKPVVRIAPGGANRFAYGYCTYWVATRRQIPWRGNANAWPRNAQAMGYKTGKTPAVGAVYAEPWLTGYGHVSYVERVNSDGSFMVSEMNYAGWNKKSTRTVGANAPGLFIY